MNKKLKLSPWHDGSVVPVNKGWYQCKGKFVESCDKPVWRKWCGHYWMWRNIYNGNQLERAGFSIEVKWRGVLK